MNDAQIWIVDFGSQYTQLIVRRMRELGFSCQLMTYDEAKIRFQKKSYPAALVLSGGPQSIYEDDLVNEYPLFFQNKKLPILGICYGMQMMMHVHEGKVQKSDKAEYGKRALILAEKFASDFQRQTTTVWMSHSDSVTLVPSGFDVIMKSYDQHIAGVLHEQNPWMGLQFHPEVEHTEDGKDFLRFFFERVANLRQDWTQESMKESLVKDLVPLKNSFVLCAFSGGVDSLVAASLCYEVFGKNLFCFFVDHGLLRPQDYAHIQELQAKCPFQIEVINAQKEFTAALLGLTDPEKKRKAIGKTFIDVFEQKVHEYEKNHQIKFDSLLQGTLYPDVIESYAPHKKGGKSVTIKSHHNVGGLPEKMNLKVLEPFRFLFKDEVRALGQQLGLPAAWVNRHPFPGPGLAIRIMGEVTPARLQIVGLSDQILLEEMIKDHLYHDVWQAFTVFLPVKTVGVKGDARCEEEVLCVRIVQSTDGMTANAAPMPWGFLDRLASRITNEVRGITRVVYDLTSKPPGTIEWE